ncbi:MAG: hypothetical protein O2963_01140 [Proteobacteria bacterium]|jgi:protocatechuate 4,5-dioxygenase alpha subunit|nr:hypothetical protein [Pseudomonadota bacterium]
MKWKTVKDIETPKGPVTFTIEHSQRGYKMNELCYSLKQEKNRISFRADYKKYIKNFGLTDFEIELVESRDWLKMVHYGVSPYVIGKMAQCFDLSFIDWGSYMRGESPKDFMEKNVPLLKNYNKDDV